MTQCIASRNYDRAFETLRSIAPRLIEGKKTEPMLEALRAICRASPQHVKALELIYQVAERTADESTIPEALEALGSAYLQVGETEKAEQVYEKLVAREPENQMYRELLKQVLEKQGKEEALPGVSVLSATGTDLETEPEADSPTIKLSSLDSEQAAMVNAANENSDLLVPDNLTEKAVAELKKVLEEYPDQVNIQERIIETCRKNLPGRAAKAAEALARIFSDEGNSSAARRFQQEARELAALANPTEAFPFLIRGSEISPFSPAEPDQGQLPISQEIPLEFQTAQGSASTENPLSVGAPGTADASQASPDGLESNQRHVDIPPFNYEEAREEIRFYLDHGLQEEAYRAIVSLEQKYPEEARVDVLRRHMDESRQEPQEAELTQEWELPTSFPGVAPGVDDTALPARSAADRGASTSEVVPTTPSEEPENAFDASRELGELLEELGGNELSLQSDDDSPMHYNLGVAFREMGLLDEAIGEFQKVVQKAGHQHIPHNYLQACTLLAACFLEKEMPAIAVKWYLRALTMPGLDNEAILALQYDLGTAYEKAGDTKTALERFTEVYSQNIDYRDVAEKIRTLRREAS